MRRGWHYIQRRTSASQAVLKPRPTPISTSDDTPPPSLNKWARSAPAANASKTQTAGSLSQSEAHLFSAPSTAKTKWSRPRPMPQPVPNPLARLSTQQDNQPGSSTPRPFPQARQQRQTANEKARDIRPRIGSQSAPRVPQPRTWARDDQQPPSSVETPPRTKWDPPPHMQEHRVDTPPHLRRTSNAGQWVAQRTPKMREKSNDPLAGLLGTQSSVRSKGTKALQAVRTEGKPSMKKAKDPSQVVETRSIVEEDYEVIAPVESDEVSVDRQWQRASGSKAAHRRDAYKTRGSLLRGARYEEDVYDEEPKMAADTPVPKRRKPKAQIQQNIDVYIPSLISVNNLSRLLNVRQVTLQRKMREAGMDETSYDHALTAELASMLALEFNRNPIVDDEAAFDLYPSLEVQDESLLRPRPPIVAIMGHVDHGKTTLLDTLRSASVAPLEAGGITQHIGAFSVPVKTAEQKNDKRSITFLDTPGHAAFAAMRARGARATDIVVLVVAADDGVMPQTKEVIELVNAEAGKVGLVVAINKVDKPDADVEKTRLALLAAGVQLEALGGDVPDVCVSGLTGDGLDGLVETLSTVADILELRAERQGRAHGLILESRIQKGLGPVATVLVTRGELKCGEHLVSGLSHCKVRALSDSSGKSIRSAYPGDAITVAGWRNLPSAGDDVLQGSESDIKKALANRERAAKLAGVVEDAQAINEQRRLEREAQQNEADGIGTIPEEDDGRKSLKLVVKGDVSGSVEAVIGAIEGIGNHIVSVKIVHSGVGDVSESDVMLAESAEGMIIAFNVSTPRSVDMVANKHNVPVYTSPIIYRIMEEVKGHVCALLPPIIEKSVLGEATIQEVFEISVRSRVKTKVAGCRVTNGVIEKSKHARLIRDKETIHEGPLATLRHLKKDITEMRRGGECGLAFTGFDAIQEGDFIQSVDIIEKPGIL